MGQRADYSEFPEELRKIAHWCVFRLVPDPDTPGKLRKPPFQSKNPSSGAASTRAEDWSTFEEARKTAEDPVNKIDGIGWFFTPPFFGFDLDKVRDPETGETEQWALDFIAKYSTYTEISPSGRGFHGIGHGPVPKAPKDLEKNPLGTKPGWIKRPRIEIYAAERYFTVTGKHVSSTPLEIKRFTPEEVTEMFAFALVADPYNIDKHASSGVASDRGQIFKPMSAEKLADVLAGNWKAHYASASDAIQPALMTLWVKHKCDEKATREAFEETPLCQNWKEADGKSKWARLGSSELKKALKSARVYLATTQVKITFDSADQVKVETIDWLYQGYLPLGMYVYLFAPKGRGKTKFCDWITAIVSKGLAWCCGMKNDHRASVVLRFNLEDPKQYVLVPSLIAAGADLKNVKIAGPADIAGEAGEVDFSSPNHIQALKEAIQHYNAKLVIIEPVTNYKGGKRNSSNSEDDMRPIHTALARVAEETGSCVLGIGHTNKARDHVDPLDKALGSGASTRVARMNWFLDKNPDDKSERILSDAGSNISPIGPSLVYKIVDAEPFEYQTKEFQKIGKAVFIRTDKDITGDDLLERSQANNRTETAEIRVWLREFLTGKGEVETDKVRTAAKNHNSEWQWSTIRAVWSRCRLGTSSGTNRNTKWKLHDQSQGEF